MADHSMYCLHDARWKPNNIGIFMMDSRRFPFEHN